MVKSFSLRVSNERSRLSAPLEIIVFKDPKLLMSY